MGRWVHAFACASAVLAVASWVVTAGAAEAEGNGEARAKVQAEEPTGNTESVRLDMGLGLSGVTIVGTGNGGAGAGPLGGGLFPMASVGLEVHLAGPAWLVIRARGSYSSFDEAVQTWHAWSAGGTIGPRFETPVFEFLDVGGHVFFDASYSGMDVPYGVQESNLSLGGIAGGSLHFRPTRFFGVRLVLDVVRAGYAWTQGQTSEAAQGYAQLSASPQVELTFTF